MHAKLPNYIGQVLECKADRAQYTLLFAKIRRTLAERSASSARPGLLSWFVWLNEATQMNKTNQRNQMNPSCENKASARAADVSYIII
jgi:hypothetical protein